MKKLLSIMTALTLIISSTSGVIACGTAISHPAVTNQQETTALNQFADQSGKFKANPINKASLVFTNGKVINSKQKIDFSFELTKNATSLDQKNPQGFGVSNTTESSISTQLIAKYQGQMIYNVVSQQFALTAKPFSEPNTLVPGWYNPGFGLAFTSTIYGTANDFTIVATSGHLRILRNLLNDKLSSTSVLFNDMEWTTPDELILAQKIPLGVFYKISGQPQVWYVPSTYTALIHAEEINGKYQVVWSNVATETDQKSLPEAGDGTINSVFWKTNTNDKTSFNYHFWVSPELIRELIQLYELAPSASNYWLQKATLQNWLKNKSGFINDSSRNGVELAAVPNVDVLQPQLNATSSELIKAIQSMFSNSTNFQNLCKLVQKHPTLPYDLIFKISNQKIIFDPADSGALTNG